MSSKRGTAITPCLAASDKFVTDIVSGGKTVTTRTQGVMRPVAIDQAGIREIGGGALVYEAVFEADGIEVGLVIRGTGRRRITEFVLYSLHRLPRCPASVCPAKIQVIEGRQTLSNREPGSGMGALIQAVGDGIPLQSFDKDVESRFRRERILHAQLVGAFITDSDGARNYLVACAIYILMELVRKGGIK